MKNLEMLNYAIEHIDTKIQEQIDLSNSLIEHLSDPLTKVGSSSGSVDVQEDIKTLKREIYGMNTIRRVLEKMASNTGEKSEALMSIEEKALYLKLVRISLRVKRFFNKFKRK